MKTRTERDKKTRRKFVKVSIERFLFEPESERYILILRGNRSGREKNIVLSFDVLEFFGDMAPEFQTYTRKFGLWMDQLGLKLFRIRILDKRNSDDSAICYLRGGLFPRKIVISNVDALFLASERKIDIEVPAEFFEAESFRMGTYEEQKKMDESDLFASAVYRASIFDREVIM